jgi:predicted DNA-binding transcriptional regulator AlpA
VRTSSKHPTRHQLDRRIDLILANEPPAIDKNNPDDDLLTTPQVADWFGVSKQWLEIGRSQKYDYGPPFKKLGPKNVRYRRGSTKGWLTTRKRAAVARFNHMKGK